MSTQNQNEQTLNGEALLELLSYAMIGIAVTLKELQTAIAAQQLFGQQAVLYVDSFNPLKASTQNYQKDYDRLLARSKQFMELLEQVKELRIKGNVAEFLKSRMSDK